MMNTPNPTFSAEEREFSIHDYLKVLYKRRWMILFLFLVVFLGFAFHFYSTVPEYQAKALIDHEQQGSKILSFDDLLGSERAGTAFTQTQTLIIQSKDVARRVVEELNLATHPEFAPKTEEKTEGWRATLEDVKGWALEQIAAAKALFKTGDEKGAKTVPINTEAEVLDPLAGVINRFVQQVSVSPIKGTRMFEVGFTAKDPRFAARVANTLTREYIAYDMETRAATSQTAMQWLYDRIKEEKEAVEVSKMKVLKFKEENNILASPSQGSNELTTQKILDFNSQIAEAREERIQAESRYDQVKRVLANPALVDTSFLAQGNGPLAKINEAIFDLRRTLSELSLKYGAKHPRIVAIKGELRTWEGQKNKEIQQAADAARIAYNLALARENSLKDSLATFKKEVFELNRKAVEYGMLEQDASYAKDLYDVLFKRFKEASLTEEVPTVNIRVIKPAEPEFSPVNKKPRTLLAGLLLGLVLGVGVAFLLEYLDNKLHTPDQVENLLGIPFLAGLPALVVGKGDDPKAQLPVRTDPKSHYAEAIRGLRTGLLFSGSGKPPQVIMLTSAVPGEGKTASTSNLALTMAQAGSKVLLVDCDFRKPRQHQLFGLSRDVGLSSYLAGAVDTLDEQIIRPVEENLDVVVTGVVPPNPSELLSSKSMEQFIEEMRGRYDRILIDSPPVTAVADALVLTRVTDGVVFVINAGSTPKDICRTAVERLRAAGARIYGGIMNNVMSAKDGYSYYSGYYYYYYYYSDGEKAGSKGGKKSRSSRRKA